MTWGLTPVEFEALPHPVRQKMFRFYTWRQQRETLIRKAVEARGRLGGKIPRMR